MTARSTAFYDEWTVPAGGSLKLDINAEFIYVHAASQALFGLDLDQDGGGAAAPGAWFRTSTGRDYERIRLVNHSTTDDLRVALWFGRGSFQLQQFKFIPASTLGAADDMAVAPASTELVLAANANRRTVILTNPPTNPRSFRIGDAGTGPSRGYSLPPGDWVKLETTAAVYAYNPDDREMPVSILEIAE